MTRVWASPRGQASCHMVLDCPATESFGCVPAGVLPIESGVYDIVWQSMMPLAAALFLLEADLRG